MGKAKPLPKCSHQHPRGQEKHKESTGESVDYDHYNRPEERLQCMISPKANKTVWVSNSLSMNQYAIEHVHNAITLQELFLA